MQTARKKIQLIIYFIFIPLIVKGQIENKTNAPSEILPFNKHTINEDSSIQMHDSDSVREKRAPKSDFETTINYSARDSIRANMNEQTVWLYGDAKITYGLMSIEAEQIVIDYRNQTITAISILDSAGNHIGYPIFKNGSELYETKGIIYNLKTKRAKVKEIIAQQGEGFLKSGTAFKNEHNEIISVDNSYTTCDLEHPHFRIRAKRAKATKDQIITGPFYVEFNEIPLPVGFLFGFFPNEKESKSGIIFPSYGEEASRGFYIRNGGYFFDINEYVKASLTGDIYSKGAHALYLNSTYAKRYAYDGNLNFSYSKNFTSENIEDKTSTNDFKISWSHSPKSKKNSKFSASVNAATATYNQNNNLIYESNSISSGELSNITSTLSSNVSYSKTFSGTPFSIGLNVSHNQNLLTRQVDLLLPSLSVNMSNLYPFQQKGKTSILDNLSIGYSMSGNNRLTNNLGILTDSGEDSIATFDLRNITMFLNNSKKGIRHSIPVSHSFKALKYFTVSPTISYEEKWYFEKLNWKYDSINESYEADTVSGFNRVSNYSISAGMSTRIYGMYFVKNKHSKIKGIRHVINPSASFTYTPDFTNNDNYFQLFKTEDGDVIKSRHEGFVYGSSSYGHAASIGFGLGNNVEMKVKNAKDTVERKVTLLNNLSITSSYDLLADSFKLAPFSLAANTNLFNNKVNVNLSATLDPYNYLKTVDEEGHSAETRIDTYSWNARSFGRITAATLSFNTNLNPQKQQKDNQERQQLGESTIPEDQKQYLLQNPNAYVDFSIPWNINLGYNLTYNRAINSTPAIVQTVQASGDFSITNKWKVTYSTGYDFNSQAFTQTSLGISRDLHCWSMSLSWVPFGKFQSYNFSIAIKASVLKDLKIERKRSFTDK